MKTLRICLLLLLALLLPVRGAVAAAMLCSPASMGSQSQAQAPVHVPSAEHAHHHESMMAAADEAPAHDHAGHHDEGAAGGHHNGGSMEKCNLCCAFCTLAPMVSSLPSLPSPIDLSVISFPDLSAPAASFLSDGQERPPRST